jgi:hypothetical protein
MPKQPQCNCVVCGKAVYGPGVYCSVHQHMRPR